MNLQPQGKKDRAMRNLVNILDLSVSEIDGLIEVAADMIRMCPALNKRCKILTATKRIVYLPTTTNQRESQRIAFRSPRSHKPSVCSWHSPTLSGMLVRAAGAHRDPKAQDISMYKVHAFTISILNQYLNVLFSFASAGSASQAFGEGAKATKP